MNAVTPFTAQPMLPLILPETRTFAEWSDLGRDLLTAHRKLKWLIGDWLIAGMERYGDKARDEAHRLAQSDIDRFGPIVDTCRRFPEPARHAALTFGHHEIVAKIDPAEAEAFLAKAEQQRMTVPALKAEVRVSTNRQTTMLEDDDPEDREYRSMVQAWNRCSSIAARRMFMEAIEEVGADGEIEL